LSQLGVSFENSNGIRDTCGDYFSFRGKGKREMIKRYVGYVVGLVIASIIIYFDAGIKQAVMSGGILLVSLIFWGLLSIMRKQKENNKVDEYIKLKIDRFVSRTFMFSIISRVLIIQN
jgi:hypothetical protein